MKQIQNLYLENMPKGALYSFNQSVVKRIKNDSTLCGKPQLIPLIAKYEAAFLVEEEKFKISQKSEFTDSLNQLDDMRDSAYRGIKQIVGGYAKVPDADIQKAAKALDQLITDYRIDVDVQYKALTKEIVDLLHKNGLLINCWTVDNKDDAEVLSAWGVDFITSNILE